MARDVMHVLLDEITVSDKHRPVDPEAVLKLAKSIKSIGLQYPITVRSKNGAFELVAGRHRVEAHRALGLERIPANVVRWTDLDARMWEISENLHRAELTTIQRAEQVAEVRLVADHRDRVGVRQRLRLEHAQGDARRPVRHQRFGDAHFAGVADGFDEHFGGLQRAPQRTHHDDGGRRHQRAPGRGRAPQALPPFVGQLTLVIGHAGASVLGDAVPQQVDVHTRSEPRLGAQRNRAAVSPRRYRRRAR